MTDRWQRAEQRYREREGDRRYRRDERAWAEEVAFIKSLAKATKGTTDRFDRDELYEERESKLLR